MERKKKKSKRETRKIIKTSCKKKREFEQNKLVFIKKSIDDPGNSFWAERSKAMIGPFSD
jgi:hypothetical protein